MKAQQKKLEYTRRLFAMRQIRDCVAGSDAIKRAGELYAPMPASWREIDFSQVGSPNTTSTNKNSDDSLSITDAPWHHANPVYSAYLHRAKFPDITSGTLRGLLGVATRREAEITLPSTIAYLEDSATLEGFDLDDVFSSVVAELFQVARHALVLDVRDDNTFYIAQYDSESYINWKFKRIAGQRVQTYAEFETRFEGDDGEEHVSNICYELKPNEAGTAYSAHVTKYVDGNVSEEEYELIVQGSPMLRLPVFNAGALENTPEFDPLPLMGISDCALDIYRHSADLNQSHFMSCNPTLVFIGVDPDSAPKTVGSLGAVCLRDPNSKAEYLKTDTSALSHIAGYIEDTRAEAVLYGAQLLSTPKKAVESAESVGLQQAAQGATLVTVVENAGRALSDLLTFAASFSGGGDAEYAPNTEFAELQLSAQELTSLVNAWMSGGLSKLSLVENLSAAGRTGDRTPDEELAQIEREGPETAGGGNPDNGGADSGNASDGDNDNEEEGEDDEQEG